MAATGGQTLNDRLNAARYALAGQGLARVVCKATTEELLAPKKKHLDYLLQCTYEANVSIPQMANLLIERTGHNSWIVVFKALITVHHLMCYGNERFTQYLASSNCSFQLSNFLDKTGVKGYDMSTYIRRYAKYLNEKALSYRLVALDFAKMKRGKEEGSLRTMTNDKLLKTLPILQNQVDALLEFDCSAMDLNNNVINAAFMLLFRDLIRLFACYNDGIINLLEKYFEMQRKQCKEALDIYKKFLIRMDKVAEFLKVAENIGIDKGDIPDLTKAPSSLLEALEAHLNALEAKGKRHKDKHNKEKDADHSKSGTTTANLDEEQLKKALEEEAAMMNRLKEKHVKEKPFNPFLDAASDLASFETGNTTASSTGKSSSNDIIDLFGPNGANSQPSNMILTNQNNNLFNNSNHNGALHTQLNLNTNTNENSRMLNQSAGLIENGSSNSSINLGLKSNNDLLDVLANNSQAFHSNIFSQNNSNFTGTFNPYSPQNPQTISSSYVNQMNSTNSMQTQFAGQTMTTNTLPNYQTQLQNTMNTLNGNGNNNNLLMNHAFTTAATSNPFASGFAQQPSNTAGGSGNKFEPNFADAFGSSSSSTNGSAKRPPRPSRPPPPSGSTKPTDEDEECKPLKTENPFLMNDDELIQSAGGENPFLNFDQVADEQNIDEQIKIDPNNNVNELSDKLDAGLSVASPMPGCPPSSPFTTEADDTVKNVEPDSDVKKAINILNSET